jgi:GTP-binding protein LepA
LRALIFDSHYDSYRGAITYVRLIDGTVKKGQKIRFLETGVTHEVLELGQFVPQRRACEELVAGQVGYLVCNIKDVKQVHIGDTVTIPGDHAATPMPGYKPPQRMVYCGLYPSEGENFEELRDALEKLSINDPSFEFAPESSEALGFGFRCGFLGLLHMEIIQQRLEQEADLDLVQTAPNVTYQILNTSGETFNIRNPQDVPDTGEIEEFRQPIVRTNFLTPVEHIGPIMQLCTDRRGVYLKTEYLSPTRAMLTFDLPLAEVIYDMHDRLKSVTRGYGTMDYELVGYFPADLVRLDILVGGKKVDALSIMCDRRDADRRGRAIDACLDPLDEPAPHFRGLDVHHLVTDLVAIGATETIHHLPELHAPAFFVKLCGDFILHLGRIEAKMLKAEKRLGRRHGIEGIEPCGGVSQAAESIHEINDTGMGGQVR